MKVNEAPEKIILGADKDSKIINDYWVVNDYTDNIKIQYVRMDAFIKKACECLKENKDHPLIGCEDPCLSGYLTDEFIEEFKKQLRNKL